MWPISLLCNQFHYSTPARTTRASFPACGSSVLSEALPVTQHERRERKCTLIMWWCCMMILYDDVATNKIEECKGPAYKKGKRNWSMSRLCGKVFWWLVMEHFTSLHQHCPVIRQTAGRETNQSKLYNTPQCAINAYLWAQSLCCCCYPCSSSRPLCQAAEHIRRRAWVRWKQMKLSRTPVGTCWCLQKTSNLDKIGLWNLVLHQFTNLIF